MAIPTYDDIMLPLLKLASDKQEHSIRTTIVYLAKEFNLTTEEQNKLLPDMKHPIFDKRVTLARDHLGEGGLFEIKRYGNFIITEQGLQKLQENTTDIYTKSIPELVKENADASPVKGWKIVTSSSVLNLRGKFNRLLPSFFFECYFFVYLVASLVRFGIPDYSWWIPNLILKFGIGYLIYRLYISKSRKFYLLGPSLLVLLIAVAFITYYLHSTTMYRIVGGYEIILFGTNTFFIFRYFKYPNIIANSFKKMNYAITQSTNSKYISKIENSITLMVCCAIFVIIVNAYNGITNLVIALIWIIYHLLAEGIIKFPDRISPKLDSTLNK
jgi:hypothetical protein